MNGYQNVPVTCPSCNRRFVAPVLTIIDATESPETKALFLSGQANIAACPHCGHAGMLAVPLVYHDADKELLFTFAPSGPASEMEQQRVIGDLTNRLISGLPVEQRKGYLLQPRGFLRLEAMVEAILEADGITREMLEAQRAKTAVLELLLGSPNAEARRSIAQQHDAEIDYGFFRLLTLNLELAEAENQNSQVEQLLELRAQLLEWTTQGREIAAREEAIRSLGPDVKREELLERLVEAALAGESVKIETLAAVARPLIDYGFYQQLTARIEDAARSGRAQEAETLRGLRETILGLTAQIDAQVKQATNDAARFLDLLTASDDPEALLRANPERVDGLFLDVLAASIEAAAQAGQVEAESRLKGIHDTIMRAIQEGQPPELRLVNELLAAEFPEGSRTLLEEHREEIDAGLLEFLKEISDGLASRGKPELAQRVAAIGQQAAALLG